jgi:hypothetical protein
VHESRERSSEEPVAQPVQRDPAQSRDGLLDLQRSAGNQAVARLVASRPMLQRHGPGINNRAYLEARNVHFERHLDDWKRVFGITTIGEVRKIAKELFAITRQEDWENKGGNYAVFHEYMGGKVALVWGEDGITSCYPKEPNPAYQKKSRGGQGGSGRDPYSRGQNAPSVGYRPKERQEQTPAPAWSVPAAAAVTAGYGGGTQSGYPSWSASTPAWSSQQTQGWGGGYTPSPAPATQATATATTINATDARQVEAIAEGTYAVYKGYTWMKYGGQLYWWNLQIGNWAPRYEGQTDWLAA